eukprot:scaffold5723_cov150-Skeletonema_dohrnii-CCMP3373.AAC.3
MRWSFIVGVTCGLRFAAGHQEAQGHVLSVTPRMRVISLFLGGWLRGGGCKEERRKNTAC